MNFMDEEVVLTDIKREIEAIPGEVSFIKESALFDQLILERLSYK
jgi:hypothetical protein